MRPPKPPLHPVAILLAFRNIHLLVSLLFKEVSLSHPTNKTTIYFAPSSFLAARTVSFGLLLSLASHGHGPPKRELALSHGALLLAFR